MREIFETLTRVGFTGKVVGASPSPEMTFALKKASMSLDLPSGSGAS